MAMLIVLVGAHEGFLFAKLNRLFFGIAICLSLLAFYRGASGSVLAIVVVFQAVLVGLLAVKWLLARSQGNSETPRQT